MPSQYANQLKIATVKRLANHGLDALIEYDETNGKDGTNSALPESRTSNESTWVGIDVAGNPLSDPTKAIEHLVADYCSKTLHCKVEDIIWSLVGRYQDNGTRYRIINASGCWGGEKYTLIYMVKTDVLKSHDLDMISHCFEQDLLGVMKDHVTEYTAWLNNEVLKVTVTPKQNITTTEPALSATEYCIYPITDEIDTYTNEAIDSLIFNIKNSAKTSVTLSLYTDRDMPSYVIKPLYFIRTMEHVFGFTPVLSDLNFNVHNRIFDIDLMLDSIPPFSVLKENTIKTVRGERFDLVDQPQSHIGWLIDRGDFEIGSLWDVLDVVLADKPYSEWPPILISALMTTLCAPIATMRLEKTSISMNAGKPDSKNCVVISYVD